MDPINGMQDVSDDESDETVDYAPNQVLPVANLGADFDGVPQDGLEYLFTVRRDAKLLPRFTKVVNPYHATVSTVSQIVERSDNQALHSSFPTEEWRESFLEGFRRYRRNVRQVMSDDSLSQTKKGSNEKDDAVPNFQNRERWWEYITGSIGSNEPFRTDTQQTEEEDVGSSREGSAANEVENNREETFNVPANQPILDQAANSGSVVASATPEQPNVAESKRTPHEPTLRRIKQLPMRNVLQLLSWHSMWLNAYAESFSPESSESANANLPAVIPPRPITEIHHRWMFSLMGVLDDHLTGQDISTLRTLARACIQVAKYISQTSTVATDEEVDGNDVDTSQKNSQGCAGLWMIVTAVVGIWGQRDIWDEAKSEMKVER